MLNYSALRERVQQKTLRKREVQLSISQNIEDLAVIFALSSLASQKASLCTTQFI